MVRPAGPRKLVKKIVRIIMDGRGRGVLVFILPLYPYFVVAGTAKREAMAQSYFYFVKLQSVELKYFFKK